MVSPPICLVHATGPAGGRGDADGGLRGEQGPPLHDPVRTYVRAAGLRIRPCLALPLTPPRHCAYASMYLQRVQGLPPGLRDAAQARGGGQGGGRGDARHQLA